MRVVEGADDAQSYLGGHVHSAIACHSGTWGSARDRRLQRHGRVTDTDPKGLNVRTTPGGAVLTRLVDRGDWIELHVTGLQGDWYEIDRANQVNNDNPDIDGVM